MTNESPPNDRLKSVWQNQPSEGIRMSVDEIRRRAGKFHKKIYRRNAREYVAGLAAVVFSGFELWRVPDALTRVGMGLMITGMLYLMVQLHRKGSARNLTSDLGLASGLDFFRRELERQRDLVGSVWSWYLGPLIPGWVVLMVAFARANPGHLRHFGLSLAGFNVFAALAFVFVWKLNQRAARSLQRQIDELNGLEGQR
jgi:hypothetical protein